MSRTGVQVSTSTTPAAYARKATHVVANPETKLALQPFVLSRKCLDEANLLDECDDRDSAAGRLACANAVSAGATTGSPCSCSSSVKSLMTAVDFEQPSLKSTVGGGTAQFFAVPGLHLPQSAGNS